LKYLKKNRQNFPVRNLCQFNKSNRKPDHKRSKHWHNCADAPVKVPIIKKVEGSDEVRNNVRSDENHVEDEKHDELLYVFPLSTV
jgi:hypothetical protein